MSDQNPIHRDRGRRDNMRESRLGAKETFSQNEASIEQQASVPKDQDEDLTEEERTAVQEEAAADRFSQIGKETSGDDESAG
jgi:hypothetical protein